MRLFLSFTAELNHHTSRVSGVQTRPRKLQKINHIHYLFRDFRMIPMRRVVSKSEKSSRFPSMLKVGSQMEVLCIWAITCPCGGISDIVLCQLFCHSVISFGQFPVNHDQTFGCAKVLMKQLLVSDFTILIHPPSTPATKAKREMYCVNSCKE